MKRISGTFTRKKNFSIRKYFPEMAMFLIVSFLNFTFSCTYYKVKTYRGSTAASTQVQNSSKYIILHQGNNAWHLKNIVLNEDKKELHGTLDSLPPEHQYYKYNNVNSTNRYRISKGDPTYEVHIYISEYAEEGNSQITIPLSSISLMEVYDKAVGATVSSYIFTGVVVVASAMVIALIIIILTKSSCPFVYINNGSSYPFAGEMYGGAIYSSLERDDYMPLPGFKQINGTYELKIANELLEKQYTNLAELVVVQHPENMGVILDKYGNVQTITKPQAPLKALSDGNADYTNQVFSKDKSAYLFNEDSTRNTDLSSLTLTFKKPENINTGKVVLNAKNSFWLDYIYGKFTEQFGTRYQAFAEKQKTTPAKVNKRWALEQGIPLSVYVETGQGWTFVDYFDVMGPLAGRDLVMPIDLKNVKGDEVKIKLECGFMFWEIDYAAIDFTANIPVRIDHISAMYAIDEKGKDITSQIKSTDDRYLTQPDVGNMAIIKYQAPARENNLKETSFLHSRGYYEYIRDYKNKPNIAYLQTFKKAGAFTKFSKERYYEFTENKAVFSNALNDAYGK